MIKHFLTVLSFGGSTDYRAPCGYTSNDPKEFTSITNPSMKGVTCPACLEWVKGAVVIVKEVSNDSADL